MMLIAGRAQREQSAAVPTPPDPGPLVSDEGTSGQGAGGWAAPGGVGPLAVSSRPGALVWVTGYYEGWRRGVGNASDISEHRGGTCSRCPPP